MKNILAIFVLILAISHSNAQNTTQNYYFPNNTSYNPNVPSPKEFLGFEIGDWHVTHDRLVAYMYALAQSSDRIKIEETGRTYESRPLLLLTITAKNNLKNIEQIRRKHLQLTQPDSSAKLDIDKMPAVVYIGYSVHGNEPSGSNASLLTAYHLAAAEGDAVDKLLTETIILLDPSMNPDGLQRFAGWVNSNKSFSSVADPNNMELNEPWPRGRTNHYWFDLNRDWLPVQLPESQARLRVFHQWKPNVLTDHHEMGTNSTFFFQPGIPSRNNPLTPEKVFDLTAAMGQYHAEALDSIGSFYYTKENYDDFFYGKGSTYPDINGGVGILFEQASSRGHAQESIHGVLTFPFTIRNQFVTSLSTLKAVNQMRLQFLAYQRDFYQNAIEQAKEGDLRAYIFNSEDDYKAREMVRILISHDIDVYKYGQQTRISETPYDSSYIIPLQQPQYNLIKAMFEKRTEFTDSLFYDVSAWTLPLALNLDYDVINAHDYKEAMTANKISVPQNARGHISKSSQTYAYAFEPHHYLSHKVLYKLLVKGYKVKVANSEFDGPDGKIFDRGTILIPMSYQDAKSETLYEDLKMLAETTGVDIFSLSTGLGKNGVSLGSPSFDIIKKPEILLLAGDGTSSYEVGEVWHLLDQRLGIPSTRIEASQIGKIDLSRYNTIIMVDGSYSSIHNQGQSKLKEWIQSGGNVIAQKSALKYLSGLGIAKFDITNTASTDTLDQRPYSEIQSTYGAKEIGGAIFEVDVDLTHPLLYGYNKASIPIFRNSRIFLKKSPNSFANPIVYSDNPLLSGYISDDNLILLKSSAAVGISQYGKGKIIGFTDNLNFRAFWYGTNKIFLNAIFFGSVIDARANR